MTSKDMLINIITEASDEEVLVLLELFISFLG